MRNKSNGTWSNACEQTCTLKTYCINCETLIQKTATNCGCCSRTGIQGRCGVYFDKLERRFVLINTRHQRERTKLFTECIRQNCQDCFSWKIASFPPCPSWLWNWSCSRPFDRASMSTIVSVSDKVLCTEPNRSLYILVVRDSWLIERGAVCPRFTFVVQGTTFVCKELQSIFWSDLIWYQGWNEYARGATALQNELIVIDIAALSCNNGSQKRKRVLEFSDANGILSIWGM